MPSAPKPDEDKRLPSAKVEIRDFLGYVPNSDPHDLPPGASVSQVNVSAHVPGQLTVRRGYQQVRFS